MNGSIEGTDKRWFYPTYDLDITFTYGVRRILTRFDRRRVLRLARKLSKRGHTVKVAYLGRWTPWE